MVKPTKCNQIRSVGFVGSFSTHWTWNVVNVRCNVWTIRNFTMNDVRWWFMTGFQPIRLMFQHCIFDPEIKFHICPQPTWNICCKEHVVFLPSCCRTKIFFSWSFVRPSWSFNIFHIWNWMCSRVFLWKQRRQVVFLWLLDPWINKKTIKNEQSKPDCKNRWINRKCKIYSRKDQSFFIVGCWISKCFFLWKSNHDVFFHFCGFVI